jgi:N-acetylglucosamine-6-phosphate deacetylase
MGQLMLENGNVVLPEGERNDVSVIVADEQISEILEKGRSSFNGGVINVTGLDIFPGLVDLHIHGAVGVDVNAADADGLKRVAEFLAARGVTAWVPTLVPDSDKNYRRVIGEIDRLMEMQEGRPVAQAVGVHYEGVFANEKMCGALRPRFFKTFSGTELAELSVPKRGVKMMTFAPEVEGGIELVREMTRRCWVASIGHTKADVETLDRAFAAGARHLTHFFNAMSGVHHRDVGVAGWALANEAATFDIIADGVHVNPKMLAFAVGSKTPEKVTLISDSVAPAGLGDGEFELWDEKISVTEGRTQNERGSIAGSVITMLDAVRRMLSLGFSKSDVAKMASLNPAKLLGIDDTHGSIEVGKRADLVGIDARGDVCLVSIGGRIVLPEPSLRKRVGPA